MHGHIPRRAQAAEGRAGQCAHSRIPADVLQFHGPLCVLPAGSQHLRNIELFANGHQGDRARRKFETAGVLSSTNSRRGQNSNISRPYSLTAWRNHPVKQAPQSLDISGTESPLANWITGAMRAATGADIALYNRIYYRGLTIPAGTVDIVDVIQCSRPLVQYLATTQLTGREIAEIIEANLGAEERLVQVSAPP